MIMNTRALALAVFLSVALTFPEPSLATAVAAPLPKPSVEYVVSLAQPESHTAQISMRISVLQNQTEVSFSISCGESIRRSYLTIKSVQAHSDILINLPINRLDNFTWRVSLAGYREVLVQYDVNYAVNRGINAYIGRDYAVIDEGALLLNPWPRRELEFYNVRLEQPSSWTFVSLGSSEYSRLFESLMMELGTHILAFGRFFVSSFSQGTMTVKLALLENLTATSLYYPKLIGNLHDQYERIAGKLSNPTILVIVAPRALNIVGFSHGRSLYVDSTEGPTALSHELFHLWNGQTMYPAGNDAIWFEEGVTEFYAKTSLYRLNMSNREEDRDLFLSSYRWYKSIISSSHDVALSLAWTRYVETGDWTFRDVVYEKGQLVAYLINETISEKTKGQKNLDDLMRYMYASFGYPQNKSRPWFTVGDIKDSLTYLTSSSWQDFFDKYVLGSALLPLPRISARENYVTSLRQSIEDLGLEVTHVPTMRIIKPLVAGFVTSAQYERTQAVNDYFDYRYRQAQEHVSKASAHIEAARWVERGILIMSFFAVAVGAYLFWRRRRARAGLGVCGASRADRRGSLH